MAKKRKRKKRPRIELIKVPPKFTKGGLFNEEERKANKKRSQWLWRLKKKMEGWRERPIAFHINDEEAIMDYIEQLKKRRRRILKLQRVREELRRRKAAKKALEE